MVSPAALTSFLRRLSALLLAGLFLLLASGFADACVEDHGTSDKTEHVVLCKCACHSHLQVPESDTLTVEFDLSEAQNCQNDTDPVPDAEPTGIFRPPKHLV